MIAVFCWSRCGNSNACRLFARIASEASARGSTWVRCSDLQQASEDLIGDQIQIPYTISVSMYRYIYIYMSVFICIYLFMSIYLPIPIYLSVYLSLCLSLYIYVYIYIYVLRIQNFEWHLSGFRCNFFCCSIPIELVACQIVVPQSTSDSSSIPGGQSFRAVRLSQQDHRSTGKTTKSSISER